MEQLEQIARLAIAYIQAGEGSDRNDMCGVPQYRHKAHYAREELRKAVMEYLGESCE